MKLVLPPRTSASQLDAALKAFSGVVDADWVLASDSDRDAYLDAYAPGDGSDHVAAAAVAPASREEVQAILRLANEHRVPLWPVSRGKNLGYGYAAPLVSGSVVLDLTRMNRILEIDEKHAYCVIEPGVGFYDLYNHLIENKIPLWMSIPGNAWGSMIGNALERGLGYTPYGDHASKLCGMEVVLPDGEVVRTGMGAMAGAPTWQAYPFGYGPAWDQAFVQSNYGVVTKAGVWLMPEPEATLTAKVGLPQMEDIVWAVDELGKLRTRGVIEHPFVFGNYMRDAVAGSRREDWHTGPGAVPDSAGPAIMKRFGTGWWNFALTLYGSEETVQAQAKVVNRALEPHLGKAIDWKLWTQGQPYEGSPRPAPSVFPLQVVNWRGGRGGHLGFSPVLPQDGRAALEQVHRAKARFEEHGIDYFTSFTMGHRHINNINMIIYDRDDPQMVSGAKALFRDLVSDARAHGFAEYRAHISYMDLVADTYDWNGGALRRLNERVKDALDPNGILAPGKNGIWPRAYRGTRA